MSCKHIWYSEIEKKPNKMKTAKLNEENIKGDLLNMHV